jgi:hypothetical protein
MTEMMMPEDKSVLLGKGEGSGETQNMSSFLASTEFYDDP